MRCIFPGNSYIFQQVSVGLEDIRDLIADFENAFALALP